MQTEPALARVPLPLGESLPETIVLNRTGTLGDFPETLTAADRGRLAVVTTRPDTQPWSRASQQHAVVCLEGIHQFWSRLIPGSAVRGRPGGDCTFPYAAPEGSLPDQRGLVL